MEENRVVPSSSGEMASEQGSGCYTSRELPGPTIEPADATPKIPMRPQEEHRLSSRRGAQTMAEPQEERRPSSRQGAQTMAEIEEEQKCVSTSKAQCLETRLPLGNAQCLETHLADGASAGRFSWADCSEWNEYGGPFLRQCEPTGSEANPILVNQGLVCGRWVDRAD